MKKAIIVLSVLFLVSCEKQGMRDDDDDDDKKCQVVNNESVPATVQTAFKTKYPQNAAEKWFNKDDNGYTARFSQNGNKVLAQFDNNGNFKTENVMPTSPPSNGGNNHEHHGHHRGFFKFGHHKHHGNCNHEHHDEKESGCHEELVD